MNPRLLVLFVGWLSIAVLPRLTLAEERYREFLNGLRERQYFDFALVYLDQLSQRTSLPDDIRQIIPYEKAMTLRENAKQIRNVEKQFEQLDRALAYLDQFSRENPDHPNNADANLDRAQILLQKAEAEIVQAKSPANKSTKADFQRRGRDFIEKAREGLKLAFDRHEAALQKMPAYVDEQKEPTLHAERAQIERSLILEALNLAKCTYQEAQSYEPNSREFKQLLNQAAGEFEKVHQKYRSQLGGLHARAWQGKCFEDLGDRQKALGIYNELLDKTGDDSAMQSLKSQTLLFKLNCLYAREEFQPIVELAEEWLKKNPAESKTQIGLGIQWEQARAYEALGDNRNLPKPDQERFWRQARLVAQQLNRFPGEYRDTSLSMMQRVQLKLGGKERKPDDFDAAYSMGRQSYNTAQDLRKELDSATRSGVPEDIARLNKDWNNELSEAARYFELAATLVSRRDNQKDVAASRLLQAYTNFYLRRNFEAAILARFVARTSSDEEGGTAIEAAYMSMAAFVQAYNEIKVEPDKKLEDMRLIIHAADLIIDRWPESEKANEARMVLGRLYTAAKKPVEAADWFKKIPESDPKFAEAQLAAGQAYWVAYGAAARLPKETRPNPEQLDEWKTVSEEYLRRGIQKLTAVLPDEGSMPQELASAKIYLAEILLSQGKEAEAASILLNDPQSVVKAVTVIDESSRPEKGIQSRSVARSVYTLLLRAYIGMGVEKLSDARAAMRTLESIAAGDSHSDLTELYIGLGRVLKVELERFRNNGETLRFKKLMTAFESFLDDMSKKQDGQTLGSLSWIGEAYFALGEIATDTSKTKSYYDRSSTAFQSIMKRAAADSTFANDEQLLNVKVRLVRCNRLKKQFSDAERLLEDVLKTRANDLRTQIEGASLYEDWGANDDTKKFIIAISGNPEIGLWGWGGIAKRIQQQKNYYERPELVETFLDARYSVSSCRYQYAQLVGAAEKQKELEICIKELIGSSTIIRTIPDEKRAKLNELFRDVLRAAGKPVTDLPRAEGLVPSGPVPTEKKDVVESEAKSTDQPERVIPNPTTPAESPKPSTSGDTTAWYLFLGGIVAGIVVIGWVVVKGSQRGNAAPKATRVRDPHPVEFTGIALEKSSPPSFPAPKGDLLPKQRTASATTTPVKPSHLSNPQTQPPPPRRPSAPSDPGAAPPNQPRPKRPPPPRDVD